MPCHWLNATSCGIVSSCGIVQAWRIAHPPIRGTYWLGTRPLVHVGFLKSWLAGGLKHKVVSHILEAVRQCKQESGSDQPVKIFVTGVQLSPLYQV